MIQDKTIEKQKDDIQQKIRELQERLKSRDKFTHKNHQQLNNISNQLQYSSYKANKNLQQNKYLKKRENENQDPKYSIKPQTGKKSSYEHPVNQQHPNELFEMMKTILKGQKQIQNQIRLLKLQYSKNNLKPQQHENKQKYRLFDDSKMTKVKIQQKPILVDYSDQTIEQEQFESKKDNQSNDEFQQKVEILKHKYDDRRKAVSSNKSRFKKSKSTKKDKMHEFKLNTEMYKEKNDQKVVLTQQLKDKFWEEISKRSQLIEKQYKDFPINNCKRDHSHITNTLQLQKKLKQEFIVKIYSLCNGYIFK